MLFSSPIFLFMFLPILLIAYFCANDRLKNLVLLAFSLLFYAWGEPVYVVVMLCSIAINYTFGLSMESRRAQASAGMKKALLAICVVINIGLLIYFKYTDFFITNINRLFFAGSENPIPLQNIVMPIGISFFTFQSLSYVIDVYRGEVNAQRNFINVALYVSLFPQLIAGPIVRYKDIDKQIEARSPAFPLFVGGVRRFIIGLGKKVILANTAALIADEVFGLSLANLSTPVAWIGIAAYALQIYYDFSGYSDMAIGLGHMFGFTFLENFNYPYISKSITEFWRRWHISLSTWFRDYLYIPLGGNRKGKAKTYRNLLIVFFCTGFWHGASWNFIVWGMYHGMFQLIEKGRLFERGLKGLNIREEAWPIKVFRHAGTLLIVLIGWVFFRAESLTAAVEYIMRMFGLTGPEFVLFTPWYYLTAKSIPVLLAGMVLSTPILKRTLFASYEGLSVSTAGTLVRDVLIVGVLVFCILELASSAYNPFIYFRF